MTQTDADPDVLEALIAKSKEKLSPARVSLDAGFFDDTSSRVYYAAFHAVCAALASIGLSYSSHGQTLGAFNRELVRTGKLPSEAFRYLQRLFANRQRGDYEQRRISTGRPPKTTLRTPSGWFQNVKSLSYSAVYVENLLDRHDISQNRSAIFP